VNNRINKLVLGDFIVGIEGSNPAENVDFLLFVGCLLRCSRLRDELIACSEESHQVRARARARVCF
jgi:hypothetical protein